MMQLFQILLLLLFYPLDAVWNVAGGFLLFLMGFPWLLTTGHKPPFWP